MATVEATAETFDSLVDQDGIVLVDFWAAWCGPCKMVAPEMEKIAEKYAGAVDVVKVDVDAALQKGGPAKAGPVRQQSHQLSPWTWRFPSTAGLTSPVSSSVQSIAVAGEGWPSSVRSIAWSSEPSVRSVQLSATLG